MNNQERQSDTESKLRSSVAKLLLTQQSLINLRYRRDRELRVLDGIVRFSGLALPNAADEHSFWEIAVQTATETFDSEFCLVMEKCDDGLHVRAMRGPQPILDQEIEPLAERVQEAIYVDQLLLDESQLAGISIAGEPLGSLSIAKIGPSKPTACRVLLAAVSLRKQVFFETFDEFSLPGLRTYASHLHVVFEALTSRIRIAEQLKELDKSNEALERANRDLENRIREQRRAEAALRESEALLNQAQALAQVGSWHLNLNSNILTGSPETYRLYGLPPDQTLSLNHLLAAIHPDDRPAVREKWQAALQGEEYDVEFRIITNDSIHWIREQAQFELGPDNQPLSAVGTVQNITKRRQVEERMMVSLQEAQNLSRLKSEFVTLVSHEFRTPLSAILNAAELLEDSYELLSQEKRDQFFQMIRSEIHRLSTMIHETLAMGRIDSGQMQCRPKPLDIRRFVERVAQQARLAYKDHPEVIIQANLAGDFVNADNELLFLILLNLISNAYKYSAPEANVILTLETTEKILRFSVQDHGIGIPKEAKERMFEAFFRAPNVGRRKGTGVGLYVTKRAVEMCEGAITFDSTPGEGTTFFVSIPTAPMP